MGRTTSHHDKFSKRRSWRFHLESVWLFTFSDLKTIVGPKTLFGILNALAAPVYAITTKPSIGPYTVALAAFWVWINLLPFVIDNQRRPESILEDIQNKPWRPLPSERMDRQEAKILMMVLYPVAFAMSLVLGGHRQSAALIALGFWYNSLGGSAGVFSKNFINACGFVCFASGAMEVALGVTLTPTPVLVRWFAVVWGVVFTTVQTQDLPDQAGDALCGRRTVPLALGDINTRWLTALFMGLWSLACPWFWQAPWSLCVTFLFMGYLISLRLLLKRGVKDDKTTFRIWNGWMVVLYSIPLITHLSCM